MWYLVMMNRSIKDIIFQQIRMRLQFQLKKIKVDPVCHIQILRHA
jgi:hypothetical protein